MFDIKPDYTAVKVLETSKPPTQKDFDTSRFVDVINATVPLARDKVGNIYYYAGGCYHVGGEEIIANMYMDILAMINRVDLWKKSKLSEVIAFAGCKRPLLWDRPPLYKVNLLNGIYDVLSGKLEPHTSEYLSVVQIPHTYDPSATCPEWDKFLTEVIPGLEDYILQIMGHLLVPFMGLQMGVFLEGGGCNGKSVLLAGIQGLIGDENYCSCTMQDLTYNRFMGSRLVGKLANICDDIPSSPLDVMATSTIKGMITGDKQQSESKGKDSYTYAPFARMIFSGQEVPESKDKSFGFRRRVHVVPCVQQFQVDPQKGIELAGALSSEVEISGLLNRILPTIPYTMEKGLRISEQTAGLIHRAIPLSESVKWFIDKKLKIDPEGHIPYSFLYDYYIKCVMGELDPDMFEKGIPVASKDELITNMKEVFKGYMIVGHVKWYSEVKKPVRGYRGIALVDTTINYAKWMTKEKKEFEEGLVKVEEKDMLPN